MKFKIIAILLLHAFTCNVVVKAQSPKVTVISGATVIDGTLRTPLKNAVILIEGNRIKQVRAKNKIKLPQNAEIIDASGKFVIPGLADMHIHPGSSFLRDNVGGQMLASGFTTVFLPSGPSLDNIAELRNLSRRDDSKMPRVFAVGPGFTVKDSHAAAPRYGTFLVETADEARAKVREYKAAGVDAIKLIYEDGGRAGNPTYPMMKPEIMRAIIDEAHKQGLKAYVHALNLKRAKEALEAGADGMVHTVLSEPVDDEYIRLMKRKRAVFITTHTIMKAFADIETWMQKLEAMDARKAVPQAEFDRFKSFEAVEAFYKNVPGLTQEQMGFIKNNLRKVYDAGILVVAGTDRGPYGVSSQLEIVFLVEDGLKPIQALQTATINAAKMLGREREQGTIEAGKLADLVILDADPLADISNIRRIYCVIKSGVVYDPAQLLQNAK
ncbi:MAG TPA: amidohydrolase family protein [Pyrinomonadaceae bacterium]|nr:amidohydrolase family protein [Pyrinomonadaceae bacterium]